MTIAGERFSVTQLSPGTVVSPSCTYATQLATQAMPASGGQGSAVVSAAAGCAWTATSSAAWITGITPSGTGNGTVIFTVVPNPGAARSGTVTIATQTFTITQAGTGTGTNTPCAYGINPISQTVSEKGGSYEVTITATNQSCGWTASVQSGSAWLSVAPASGTGNGKVTFTVSKNKSDPRTGALAIAQRTFTVIQPGKADD
jgi:hypothetical protein